MWGSFFVVRAFLTCFCGCFYVIFGYGYAIIIYMNPSYNNGGAGNSGNAGNIPGVKPGVIASGSAEPVLPVGATISGGPSRTPTGGRPVGSEIVLNDDGASKRKRNLIIAGVLAGVLVAVLIVALIVVMNQGRSNTTGTVGVTNFNKLINYVTSGIESDKTISEEYTLDENYYLEQIDENGSESDKRVAYNKTNELMSKFTSEYNKNHKGEENSRLAILINSTNDMIGFINVMNFSEKLFGYEIREMGKTKSVESAKKQALAYYDFSGMDNNSYVTQFMESYTEWVNALLSDSDAVANLYEYVEMYYDLTDDFVASVYNINDMIQGRPIMEDGDEDE